MFYQSQSSRIDTPSTYLDPQLVFTGNYWDEFGLTPFYIPDPARVLMLGVGLGGGLRPLLSSTKKITLDCVDSDAGSLKTCTELFKREYPNLNFNTHYADAKNYILNKANSYDFIWVDLYNSDSYADLNFDGDFFTHLKLCLSTNGILAVNAYGIPTQFSPLTCGSAQSAVAANLQNIFAWVGVLPHRRNQTLFASDQKPQLMTAHPHPQLCALDKKSFKVQSVRAQTITNGDHFAVSVKSDFSSTFQAQDQFMRAGWKLFFLHLQSYQIQLTAANQLLELIQNEAQITQIVNQALLQNDRFVLKTICILCSGESFLRPREIDWFFRWTLTNATELQTVLGQDYLQIWLTQAWALILNPSKKYRFYSFQVSALIDEAL